MDPKSNKGGLEVKIRRVRTRLAASVKTGSGIQSQCPVRSDPTDGAQCPTGVLVCGGTKNTCNTLVC